MAQTQPHIVIIGGGFGGLYAAKSLKKANARVTMIDRTNYHLFQPLLYQVATAALNPSDIAMPIRSIIRDQKNTSVILGEVVAIDRTKKKVILKDGSIFYDYLIVATGATHSYFGHDEWAKQAPGLKSIEDALTIRRRILLAFEAAERESDPLHRLHLLTFIVVGGGPTGVELAGALAEIARHTLARDFRNIDPTQAQILLLEGTSRVLPTYPEDLSRKAKQQLTKLGVRVCTNTKVTQIDAAGVVLSDGAKIGSKTVLWAAGVKASPLAKSLNVDLDRVGRVKVRSDLSIPGDDFVFVIGDLAALEDRGKMVPGVAPAAIQEGRHVAQNILRRLAGRNYEPFHYHDKGSLATIGRAAGVAEIKSVHFSGFPAWLSWLVVHLFFLIGFRNRYLVIFQWAWSYLTYQRGARLITGNLEPILVSEKPPLEKRGQGEL